MASYAENLVPGDSNSIPDIFLHDRVSGHMQRVNVRTDIEYNLVYIVDVSGSTDDDQNQDCNGDGNSDAADDVNGDGDIGDTLDCEIAGVLALNDAVATIENLEVALVSFSGAATTADFAGSAFTSPYSDDFTAALSALDSGGATDFDAALQATVDAAASEPAGETTIGLFMTDGAGTLTNPGGPLDDAVADGITVHTFAVGASATTCNAGQDIEQIASATGGTCTEVADPTALAAAIESIGAPAQESRAKPDGNYYHVGHNYVSEDGRFIMFDTYNQLHADDINEGAATDGDMYNSRDIYLHDLATRTTELISKRDGSSGVALAPSSWGSMDAQGRFIAFESKVDCEFTVTNCDSNGQWDIFRYDRHTGNYKQITYASGGGGINGWAVKPKISNGGRFIAFATNATNLDGVNDTNGSKVDMVVFDALLNKYKRVAAYDPGDAESGSISHQPWVSDDGKRVVFVSESPSLVGGDTNNALDAFVYDFDTDAYERISVNPSNGDEADGDSAPDPVISPDGEYVIFASEATNLVAGADNGSFHTYLYEVATSNLVLLDESAGGEAGNADSTQAFISADNQHAIIDSAATNLIDTDANASRDIFVRKMLSDLQPRFKAKPPMGHAPHSVSFDATLSEPSADIVDYSWDFGDGTTGSGAEAEHVYETAGTYFPSLTITHSDGRTATRGIADIPVQGLSAGHGAKAMVTVLETPGDTCAGAQTRLVSVDASGASAGTGDSGRQGIDVGATADSVAFESRATDLTPDVVTGQGDVFKRNVSDGATTTASAGLLGAPGNYPSLYASTDATGRFIAFASDEDWDSGAHQVRDVWLKDTLTKTITRVSAAGHADGPEPNGHNFDPSISDDGRYVAFTSDAADLIIDATGRPVDENGNGDVYVWDRTDDSIELVSVRSDGVQGNAPSYQASVSSDGEWVAFASEADNFTSVPDVNDQPDVFIKNMTTGELKLVSYAFGDKQTAYGTSIEPSINDAGDRVAFTSTAHDLVNAQGWGGDKTVYMRDIESATTTLVAATADGSPVVPADQPDSDGAGTKIAFVTSGDWPSDANGATADVLVKDTSTSEIAAVSVNEDGEQADADSTSPAITSDGTEVAFASSASNLSDAANGNWQVYLRECVPESEVRIFGDATVPTSYGGDATVDFDVQLRPGAPDPHYVGRIRIDGPASPDWPDGITLSAPVLLGAANLDGTNHAKGYAIWPVVGTRAIRFHALAFTVTDNGLGNDHVDLFVVGPSLPPYQAVGTITSGDLEVRTAS